MKPSLGTWLLAVLLVLCFSQLIAQTNNLSVSGVITSSTDQKPLTDVSVRVKGAATGTTTDASGRFSIYLPSSSAILVISHTGFKNMEHPVQAGKEVALILEAN